MKWSALECKGLHCLMKMDFCLLDHILPINMQYVFTAIYIYITICYSLLLQHRSCHSRAQSMNIVMYNEKNETLPNPQEILNISSLYITSPSSTKLCTHVHIKPNILLYNTIIYNNIDIKICLTHHV